jgi:hypothetical protein
VSGNRFRVTQASAAPTATQEANADLLRPDRPPSSFGQTQV